MRDTTTLTVTFFFGIIFWHKTSCPKPPPLISLSLGRFDDHLWYLPTAKVPLAKHATMMEKHHIEFGIHQYPLNFDSVEHNMTPDDKPIVTMPNSFSFMDCVTSASRNCLPKNSFLLQLSHATEWAKQKQNFQHAADKCFECSPHASSQCRHLFLHGLCYVSFRILSATNSL